MIKSTTVWLFLQTVYGWGDNHHGQMNHSKEKQILITMLKKLDYPYPIF